MTLGESFGFGAAAAGSGFVVVGVNRRDVYPRTLGQIFDAAGKPLRPPFFVDLAAAPVLAAPPKVVSAADGSFSVVWVGRESAPQSRAIVYLRRFKANGGSLGQALRLADPARSGDIAEADVVRAPDGKLLVTWFGAGPWYAAGQLIAPSGVPLGTPFPLGAGTVERPPAAVFTADGGFLVSWLGTLPELPDEPGAPVYGIFGRFYDAAGRPRGESFLTERAGSDSLAAPVVAGDAQGRLFVAWLSSRLGARVVEIGPDGLPGTVLVHPSTRSSGTPLALAAWGDGHLALAWGKRERLTFGSIGLGVQRFAAGAAPGVLRFELARSAGLESGSFVARVERREGNAGLVSARYSLLSGAARSGEDFLPFSGTVTFADGESNAVDLVLPVLDDAVPEGTETLLLTLAEPAGGARLAAPTQTAIEIRDDDTVSPLLREAAAPFTIEPSSLVPFARVANPVVAGLAGGGFVVAWEDWIERFQVIPFSRSRVYDAAGNAVASSLWLSAGALSIRLAAQPGGGFVMTGDAFNLSSPSTFESLGSFGQRFDRVGRPLAPPFPLPVSPAAIAVGKEGSLLALTGGPVVLLHRFGSGGQRLGAAVTVTRAAREFALASDALGRSFVAWTEGVGTSRRLFVRRLDAQGRRLGGDLNVDPFGEHQPDRIALAAAPDGRFVIVWQGPSDGDGLGIFGRRFAASGAPAGPVFQVNSETVGEQSVPRLAVQGDGRFLVIWQVGSSAPAIRGQYFAADGTWLGREAPMGGGGGAEADATLATDAAGRYTLVWRNPNSVVAITGRRLFEKR